MGTLCRRSRYLPTVGGVVGMLQPGVRAQNAAPSSAVQPQVPGVLNTQRWCFCPIPTAALALALFPILLSPQTDSLAVCKCLASTQLRLTLPPFGFLIAEKFIRSQTIASSEMPRENNQASRSPSVRLPLLNGARWCLSALPGQMIDVHPALQAGVRGPGRPRLACDVQWATPQSH